MLYITFILLTLAAKWCTADAPRLLSLLVSGHSQVVSAGELKMLSNPDPQRRLCSCHRQVPSECPFWGAVEQRVRERVGCSAGSVAAQWMEVMTRTDPPQRVSPFDAEPVAVL